MTLTLLNVIYVLVAIAMTGFILVQRGAGAQAGSGFGAGASATVFGSRGAGNFLTRSTAILAAVFFVLSLGMSMYVSRSGLTRSVDDVGVMEEQPAATGEAPAAVPTPAASDVPIPEAAPPAPAATASDVPPAPAAASPTPSPAEDAETPPNR